MRQPVPGSFRRHCWTSSNPACFQLKIETANPDFLQQCLFKPLSEIHRTDPNFGTCREPVRIGMWKIQIYQLGGFHE